MSQSPAPFDPEYTATNFVGFSLSVDLIAADPARVHTGVELAERSHIPAPTVAKLLKTLTRGGLLESTRGAHGGYRLVRAPAQVSVAEVIRALEGPIGVTECSIHEGSCGIESQCGTRNGWRLINGDAKFILFLAG